MAPVSDPNWPKHRDGRPKRLGDMTPAERERLLRPFIERLNEEVRADRGDTLEDR